MKINWKAVRHNIGLFFLWPPSQPKRAMPYAEADDAFKAMSEEDKMEVAYNYGVIGMDILTAINRVRNKRGPNPL